MNRHGNKRHGGCGTLTYARWKGMMQRCYSVGQKSYPRYGGAGITVAERWHDFSMFLLDMGECPNRSMTLDRINGEMGYGPDNCRWATKAEQNRNRPNANVMLTHNGMTKCVAEWAADTGISATSILHRLKLGWDTERTLTTPKYGSTTTRHPNLTLLTKGGVTKSILDWAKDLGMRPGTLRARLALGWDVQRALATPLKSRI